MALAELRQKKSQYETMTERLRMETADMEAQRVRAKSEEETFDEVARETVVVGMRRRDHEEAIFAQFVLECDGHS